jgi:UDP-N-acetylmuramoylalanine--D-glutamate ligase
MLDVLETDIMTRHDLAGRKISVLGAARSGVAVAELLGSQGARVFVSDSAAKADADLGPLAALGIAFETGGHSERLYDAELIVASPGVPATAPAMVEARRRGLRIISEIELASWFCPSPIVAVTGTNGKTTTTTLIGRLFHDAKQPHVLAGNIGTAFSAVVARLDERTTAVLEISSFQLDGIETFRPAVAVILNITPDHLDRYNNRLEDYIASKCRIFMNQTMSDVLIYNADDPATREAVEGRAAGNVTLIPFSAKLRLQEGAWLEHGTLVTHLHSRRSEIIATEEISIRGIHNLYNAMAATLAAQLSGVGVPSIRATLKNFKGVEHRLEFVRERNGVKYVNDSKATNVDSVWYALQAFTEPVVLLLGGRDKGNDYTRLDALVKEHVKAIVAIGESADTVVRAFGKTAEVVKAASMEEAVRTAAALAPAGSVVLLSPACASFDWFQNYEHRGRVFKEIVRAL